MWKALWCTIQLALHQDRIYRIYNQLSIALHRTTIISIKKKSRGLYFDVNPQPSFLTTNKKKTLQYHATQKKTSTQHNNLVTSIDSTQWFITIFHMGIGGYRERRKKIPPAHNVINPIPLPQDPGFAFNDSSDHISGRLTESYQGSAQCQSRRRFWMQPNYNLFWAGVFCAKQSEARGPAPTAPLPWIRIHAFGGGLKTKNVCGCGFVLLFFSFWFYFKVLVWLVELTS